MNRALPIVTTVLILLGVIGGGYFSFKQFTKPAVGTETGEEEVVKELSLEEKPYTTLVPGPSCEYTLNMSGIKNLPATVEYEIVYKNEEGVTQGASGSIKPTSGASTKKLLFGTESSGHRRCDKGVSGGNITVRYRNDDGQLLAKMETQFSIAEDDTEVMLKGGPTVSGLPAKGKHLVMGTFGLPEKAPGKVNSGPFGVFSNVKSSGTVKLDGNGDLYGYDGDGGSSGTWMKVSGKTSALEALVLVTQ